MMTTPIVKGEILVLQGFLQSRYEMCMHKGMAMLFIKDEVQMEMRCRNRFYCDWGDSIFGIVSCTNGLVISRT
jgi:hypothetical protein